MSDSFSSVPQPGRSYYHFRIPVPTQRGMIGVVVFLLMIGGVSFAMWAGYRDHEANVRLAEAQKSFAPMAEAALKKDGADLGAVEEDYDRLSKEIDHGMTLKSSKAIEVNSYTEERDQLQHQLQQIDAGLSGLSEKEASMIATDKLPPTSVLFTPEEGKALKDLRGRTADDLTKVVELTPQLTALAQHRDTLAVAERERAQETADAIVMQSEAEQPTPARVITDNFYPQPQPVVVQRVYVAPAYSYAPSYPYGYAPGYVPYGYYNGYERPFYGPTFFFGFGHGRDGGRGGHWHH